jgi:hypothetical protein
VPTSGKKEPTLSEVMRPTKNWRMLSPEEVPSRPSGEVLFRVRVSDVSADVSKRLSWELERRKRSVQAFYERVLREEKEDLGGRARLLLTTDDLGVRKELRVLPGGTAPPKVTQCAVLVLRRTRLWGDIAGAYQFKIDVEFIPLGIRKHASR